MLRTRRQHVIDEPIPLMLPNHGITYDSRPDQQVVRRLQNPVEVGGVPLTQRKLSSEGVERNSPCDPAVGSGHL
ncbi:MAG TPA: hypothetical protein VK807_13360 [Gemmatimonadaceae bacterium]|nr:hypothetical protein [Gemmatimonadaceae bacterium]